MRLFGHHCTYFHLKDFDLSTANFCSQKSSSKQARDNIPATNSFRYHYMKLTAPQEDAHTSDDPSVHHLGIRRHRRRQRKLGTWYWCFNLLLLWVMDGGWRVMWWMGSGSGSGMWIPRCGMRIADCGCGGGRASSNGGRRMTDRLCANCFLISWCKIETPHDLRRSKVTKGE